MRPAGFGLLAPVRHGLDGDTVSVALDHDPAGVGNRDGHAGNLRKPPEVEVLTGTVVVIGVDKPTPVSSVYGSCEEAEAAGE